jgi:hypothetical protein
VDALVEDVVGELPVGQGAGELQCPDHQGVDAGGWWPGTTERVLFNPAKVRTTRYRYRGAAIPSPWPAAG